TLDTPMLLSSLLLPVRLPTSLLFPYTTLFRSHAMFSTIRSNISRKRKIKFANISKTLLPLHKWTGTSALLFVLLHFVLIFYFFGFVPNTKMISGLLALFTLIGVVAFGRSEERRVG